MSDHPMQPVAVDEMGTARFVENGIVCHLLEFVPGDMNYLAKRFFKDEDRRQFAQLIGYSVSGYEELPYSTEESFDAAQARVEAIFDYPSEEDRSIELLGIEVNEAVNRHISRCNGIPMIDIFSVCVNLIRQACERGEMSPRDAGKLILKALTTEEGPSS